MYDSSFASETGQEHDHKIEDFKDDGESHKLFVGQVPRQLTDQDLRKVFEPYGIISEITILRDRITGAHKGCAFVTYANRSSAEKAIEAVHNKITLHHTKRPVQVRFAGKENEPKGDIKLFVGMLSKTTTESTIMELFSMYGKVKEVYLMKDHNQKSKGCAFVKFENRLDAQKAIAGLHDIYQDEGAPRKISVKYADTKEERMQRQMAKQFNQYNPYAMASGSVGGMRGLGGSGFPSGFGGGGGFGPGGGGFPPPSSGFGPPTGFGAPSGFGAPTGFGGMYSPPTEFGGGFPLFGGGGRIQQQTRGPPGANVFIYNIPDAFTDHDLQSMFSNFGNVLSALVFKDKVTGVSRGFGFVSYDSPSAAEKAIVALNGFHVGNKRLKVMLKKNGTSGVSGGGGGTSGGGRGFSPY